MPLTPDHSIYYPDSQMNITPLESHFAAVATSVDNAITAQATGMPFAMAGGSVNVGENPAPGERTTVNISFPTGRFTVPPLMSFNGRDTFGGAVISSDNITTSGARIVVGRPLTAYGWSNGTVQWTAVQMTPTSAGG